MTFREGDTVLLIDSKNKRKSILLNASKTFFSHNGSIPHAEIIGLPDASIVETDKGKKYLVITPLLREFVVSMPRGAAVIYPKDAAIIVSYIDLKHDSKVLEAGAGSGSLAIHIIKALSDSGSLTSYEIRSDFAEIARNNVFQYFGQQPENWKLVIGDLTEAEGEFFTHVVLDMLSPWEHVNHLSKKLQAGGVLCAYVATTTQMSTFVETVRETALFTEPEAIEIIIRPWHLDGLSVRPEHRMPGHTGFLIFCRRMAPGNVALTKRRKFALAE
jgi:tRNA (adenine57-N1/adenine58-N1)-methyltransferase